MHFNGRLLAPALLALALLVGSSCASTAGPDLAELYSQAAQHHDAERNPIIVIPGILGTELRDGDSQRVVWGAFSGNFANPERPEDARLIALPMQTGSSLTELKDNVYPYGVLERVRVNVLGLPIELNAYSHILGTLGVGGYRDETFGSLGVIDYGDDHFTCFQFGYDWRRDIAESAAQLHQFILEKRAYVQREIEERYGIAEADVKFDLVAHSMGGLVARYYLRYGNQPLPEDGLPELNWAGAAYVERVVMVGTPNSGSAHAATNLVMGNVPGPTLPFYEAALLGTMPSVYQLLPRGRHGALVRDGSPVPDLLSPALWQTEGWGLADPEQDHILTALLPDIGDPEERRAVALDHQRKCLHLAHQFQRAMDVPAAPPDGVELYLMAGDAIQTEAVVEIASAGLRTTGYAAGDGTVLRSSALHDERVGAPWQPEVQTPIHWTNATFLFTDHLGLTTDPSFTDNVLYILLEAPR